MRTRTQRWWIAGGLLLALISGGSAVQSSIRLAEDSQKPGHGSHMVAGFGLGGKPVAGVIWGTKQVAVVNPHTPGRDGYALGG